MNLYRPVQYFCQLPQAGAAGLPLASLSIIHPKAEESTAD